jgi:hypothetical protein
LQNTPQPGGGDIFYTDPRLNPDHLNHFYAAHWSGGFVNGVFMPPGTFMGGKDLPDPYSDWDYNDLEFIWNIRTADGGIVDTYNDAYNNAATPEPGSLSLLAIAVFGAAVRFRRCLG